MLRSTAFATAFALTVAGAVLASCSSTPIRDRGAGTTTAAPAATTTGAPVAAMSDIVATALTAGTFTELAGLVVDAGLVETLRGPGPFTVFAPTDAAFAKLPTSVLHSVQDDPATLAHVLTYHVVAGRLKVADLQPGRLATVAGVDLTVTKEGTTTLIDGHPIAAADIATTNGIIQVMGDVLVPAA